MNTSFLKRAVGLYLVPGLVVAVHAVPGIGQPAPDFAARDINGNTVRLGDYRGKIVVLESYTSVENGVGCEMCEAHYFSGAMQEWQREMTNNGVVWLHIDFTPARVGQTPARVRQEWADQKMAITDSIIDTDGYQIGRRFGITAVPEMVVIDKDGNLAYRGPFDNFGVLCRNDPEYRATLGGPGMPASRVPLVAARRRAMFKLDPRQARNYLREAVQALIAGKPVPVPETRSYGGCPVPYATH